MEVYMKKYGLLFLLCLLAPMLLAQDAEVTSNPFLGVQIILFKDKPMAFEVEFRSNMTYMIIGRFIVSPDNNGISYVKLKEDNRWLRYSLKVNNEETLVSGELTFFDTEFTYMGGGPSSRLYLFVGDAIVAEVVPR
jgi:hypothetical protein